MEVKSDLINCHLLFKVGGMDISEISILENEDGAYLNFSVNPSDSEGQCGVELDSPIIDHIIELMRDEMGYDIELSEAIYFDENKMIKGHELFEKDDFLLAPHSIIERLKNQLEIINDQNL